MVMVVVWSRYHLVGGVGGVYRTRGAWHVCCVYDDVAGRIKWREAIWRKWRVGVEDYLSEGETMVLMRR